VTRYDLGIDEDLCWGCKTCEVACKTENGAPYGIKLIAVGEERPALPDGSLSFVFRLSRCRHCEVPDCMEACNFDAIEQRRDGIVVLDQAVCGGCEACVTACLYRAITFDRAERVAMKCNLCHHRIDQGLLPACADNVCQAHCIRLVGAAASPEGEIHDRV